MTGNGQAFGPLIVLMVAGTLCAAEPVKLTYQRVSGIEFVTDHDTPGDRLHELVEHAEDVQERLTAEIGLPPLDGTLRVYLFDDRHSFSMFAQELIPSVRWSDTRGRHGFFLQRNGSPYVLLLVSDDLEQSLRHETVHAVLNAAIPNAPVWLDEGLAQCYESADGTHHCERAARILRRDWLRRDPPSQASLEEIASMQEMSAREYAAAWQYVQSLLATEDGRAWLQNYLCDIHRARRS